MMCVSSAAPSGVAGRVLQPAVVPHGHHAADGAQERVASRQDVPQLRRHQENQAGLQVCTHSLPKLLDQF